MRRASVPAFVAVACTLLGACSDLPDTLTAPELLAEDLGRLEGHTLTLTGMPLSHGDFSNAAACFDDEGNFTYPCNNLWGGFAIVDGEHRLPTRPSAAWTRDALALGFTPQPSCYDGCQDGERLGCHGNDDEAFCAPTLPQNIVSAIGRVVSVPPTNDFDSTQYYFEVDEVIITDTPVYEETYQRTPDHTSRYIGVDAP